MYPPPSPTAPRTFDLLTASTKARMAANQIPQRDRPAIRSGSVSPQLSPRSAAAAASAGAAATPTGSPTIAIVPPPGSPQPPTTIATTSGGATPTASSLSTAAAAPRSPNPSRASVNAGRALGSGAPGSLLFGPVWTGQSERSERRASRRRTAIMPITEKGKEVVSAAAASPIDTSEEITRTQARYLAPTPVRPVVAPQSQPPQPPAGLTISPSPDDPNNNTVPRSPIRTSTASSSTLSGNNNHMNDDGRPQGTSHTAHSLFVAAVKDMPASPTGTENNRRLGVNQDRAARRRSVTVPAKGVATTPSAPATASSAAPQTMTVASSSSSSSSSSISSSTSTLALSSTSAMGRFPRVPASPAAALVAMGMTLPAGLSSSAPSSSTTSATTSPATALTIVPSSPHGAVRSITPEPSLQLNTILSPTPTPAASSLWPSPTPLMPSSSSSSSVSSTWIATTPNGSRAASASTFGAISTPTTLVHRSTTLLHNYAGPPSWDPESDPRKGRATLTTPLASSSAAVVGAGTGTGSALGTPNNAITPLMGALTPTVAAPRGTSPFDAAYDI
jgi:hypothetical protein